MNPTNEQIDIMEHTLRGAAGRMYCGDSPAMRELVSEGLMEFVGYKSFVPDKYFTITGRGIETLRQIKEAGRSRAGCSGLESATKTPEAG